MRLIKRINRSVQSIFASFKKMSQSQQKSQTTEHQEETVNSSQTENTDTQLQSSQVGSQKISSQKVEEKEVDKVSDYDSQLSSVSTTGLTQSQSQTEIEQSMIEGQTVPNTPPSSQTSPQ